MRYMAVIARCNRVVTRLLPAVVLFAHDVAVCARSGIIGEIGHPLRVIKRVAAQTNEYAHTATQENNQKVHAKGKFHKRDFEINKRLISGAAVAHDCTSSGTLHATDVPLTEQKHVGNRQTTYKTRYNAVRF